MRAAIARRGKIVVDDLPEPGAGEVLIVSRSYKAPRTTSDNESSVK